MKPNNYWWNDGVNKHELVFDTVEQITENQTHRPKDNFNHARLYGNAHFSDLRGVMSAPKNSKNRVTLNIIQSMCDTVTARVAKAKPMATYLTTGGSWAMQQKAKLLTKFTEGQFYQADVYKVAPKVFLDACVFGTGVMKVYEEAAES